MGQPNRDNALALLVSVVMGFFLMIPLDFVATALDWPLFTGWGLAHAGFMIAWPIFAVATFFPFRAWLRGRDVWS